MSSAASGGVRVWMMRRAVKPTLVAMGLVFLLMLPTIGQALGQFMSKISDMIIHG